MSKLCSILCIKLIEIRSKLQEQTINIEEKNTILWNEYFDIQLSKQENTFRIFKEPYIPNELDDIIPPSPTDKPISDSQNPTENLMTSLIDFIDFLLPSVQEKPFNSSIIFVKKIDYTSLFELNIKSVPLKPSILFNKILKQTELTSSPMKALRFRIIYSNGTSEPYLCKIDKLYEQFKKIFQEKKYDFNQFVIIDQNQLFIDFINNTSTPYISLEYRIIEKILLIPIILQFQEKQIEYLVTTETQISSVINRFIIDHQLKFESS